MLWRKFFFFLINANVPQIFSSNWILRCEIQILQARFLISTTVHNLLKPSRRASTQTSSLLPRREWKFIEDSREEVDLTGLHKRCIACMRIMFVCICISFLCSMSINGFFFSDNWTKGKKKPELSFIIYQFRLHKFFSFLRSTLKSEADSYWIALCCAVCYAAMTGITP